MRDTMLCCAVLRGPLKEIERDVMEENQAKENQAKQEEEEGDDDDDDEKR